MFLKMSKVALQISGSFPGIASDFIPQNPSPFKELFNYLMWEQKLDIAETFLLFNMSSKTLTDLLWNKMFLLALSNKWAVFAHSTKLGGNSLDVNIRYVIITNHKKL